MEQIPEAIEVFRSLFSQYRLEFATPVYDYATLDAVKYQLLDFGVTTKSLEPVSLFGDTFSVASSSNVVAYLTDKLPICHAYIQLKTDS